MTLPEFDDVAPNASAMIESMRAHGYSLQTAVADIIDNSIAAGCKRVWLDFNWEENDSWISITDDGKGMSEDELVNAMRLGSRSPLEERSPRDLGRFGLGLKTASFSQGRRLTVITRQVGANTASRRWDLDHLSRPDVRGWQLLRSCHPDADSRAKALDDRELPHGTQVLLECIDRVLGGADSEQQTRDRADHFNWHIAQVREHVAMVFHRFLSKGPRSLKIVLNGEAVQAWNPFLDDHDATQFIGEYSRDVAGHRSPVTVRGYVLPHRDRFSSAQDHRCAGGPSGWNAQQGFYIYRSGRLIIAGDWLKLKWQKEEHFKLARLRLDIPNSMDHEWQIDVKKSAAVPPPFLRDWLRGIAQEVRTRAKEVYAHRGKYGSRGKRTEHARPWLAIRRSGGEISYRIDRAHPLLAPLILAASAAGKAELEALLKLVEETVPVQRIWIDTAENQDDTARPFSFTRDKSLEKLIDLCHLAIIQKGDFDSEAAWDVIADFEGFQGDAAQAIIGLRRGAKE